MCGRFAFYSPAEATAALFGAHTGLDLAPRYNVAPTQDVAAIRRDAEGEAEFALLRWGLVPSWSKDLSIGNRMINARGETVAEKPSFRAAFRKRRCLILADGFYEWHSESDGKVPYFISLADGAPLAFAGLWEEWTDKSTGESVQTGTIVTTAARGFIHALHHRMPVILRPDTAPRWLDTSDDLLGDYDRALPALRAWPVTRQVNNPRNEGPALIEADGETLTG